MAEGDSSYSVKQAALRDLIRLALHQHDGIILDPTGRVASRLRMACGLPDTKPVGAYVSSTLLLMEKDGSVARDMNEQRTRTFSLSLSQKLTAAEATTLENERECCLEKFAAPPVVEDSGKSGQESLVETCQLAYLELQDYAAKSTVRRRGEMVALNVTGILKAMGLPREEQRRVRHYLRQLGLVRSHSKMDDGGHLWWWTIETRALDADALRRQVEEHPYEEVASLGSTKASSVTVRKIEPVTVTSNREAAMTAVKAGSGAPVKGDRMVALMAIIEELVGDKSKLERQICEMESAHQAEENRLKNRISQLEQQLVQRSTVDTRADELIARFGPGRATTT